MDYEGGPVLRLESGALVAPYPERAACPWTRLYTDPAFQL